MRALKSLLCLVCFLVPISASAVPIEVSFSGVIDEVTASGQLMYPSIFVGSSFSGTYVFDSVSPGVAYQFGPEAFGYAPDFTSSVLIEVEEFIFGAGPPSAVSIANDWLDGVETVDQWNTQFTNPVSLLVPYGVVAFRDDTLSRITDATDYFVNTSLAGWTSARIGVSQFTSGFGDIEQLVGGTITSLQVIPEPSTALLMGLGLLGLRARRRTI
jgi:hypothetical protein